MNEATVDFKQARMRVQLTGLTSSLRWDLNCSLNWVSSTSCISSLGQRNTKTFKLNRNKTRHMLIQISGKSKTDCTQAVFILPPGSRSCRAHHVPWFGFSMISFRTWERDTNLIIASKTPRTHSNFDLHVISSSVICLVVQLFSCNTKTTLAQSKVHRLLQ